MINSHGLVGELDHPEERLEISLQEVSHVINDMWIEGDQVMGIIDILPTPNGKIVNELLDYGTDIGISSRGAGSVGAGNVVDPDYQFITFDVYAGFKVNPDTYSIVLERFALDKWGVICPRSRVIRVPFCKADFDNCHKTNRIMYLSATFCGKRVFYEYHYGTLKHIDKSSKASDEHLPTLNISDSDIPREYRDALL